MRLDNCSTRIMPVCGWYYFAIQDFPTACVDESVWDLWLTSQVEAVVSQPLISVGSVT